MKIAFFTANMKGGGAERVMCNLINMISKKHPNYQIDLILSEKKGIFINEISSKINIINFNKKRVRSSLFSLINYFRNEKPTYFISSLDYVNITASLAHKISFSKSKLFFWEHNTLSIHSKYSISSNKLINQLLIRFFYKQSDKIITVSNQIKFDLNLCYNIPNHKIHVVYNPVYKKSIIDSAYDAIDTEVNKIGNYIVTAGRLTPQKNHINLLNAFKYIVKDYDLKLVIIGEGPDEFKIKKEINKLGLENKVYLTGFLKNPFPIIKNSELFVLSSDWEGLPTILIEALALKKQIVSTDCPSGPREILDNGKYGLLIPTSNSKKLAIGIKSILDKEIFFDETELLDRAKYFNINNSLNAFLKLIENKS